MNRLAAPGSESALEEYEEHPLTMTRTASPLQKLSSRMFAAVHGRNLVYNTCWEDPALDRVALDFRPDDRVLVITSAGCNALDYLLAGAGEVNAVDVNPRQNALLELKVAGLRGLNHDAFFELFGRGYSPFAREMYHDALRGHLSPRAQRYWDRHIGFFDGRGWRKSFYYRGTSGFFAKLMMLKAGRLQRLRGAIEELLAARTLDEQREIYLTKLRDHVWNRSTRWFLARHTTLSLIGVPWPQRNEIVTQYPGGIAQFIRNCVEAVVLHLPFSENYFWRVYFQGYYTSDCCPEYLKPENFDRLRGLLDRLHIHTGTVTQFLHQTEPGISKLVLLDHMDWMSWYFPQALVAEWNAILDKARPGARVIFRSAGLQVRYLDPLLVSHRGRQTTLGSLLRYDRELAARLHAIDRVHTYGSFSIADLPA
jgi:S-adenosylmethionine-diacylglycerol 3-amino-3-carboxypropyl transferase